MLGHALPRPALPVSCLTIVPRAVSYPAVSCYVTPYHVVTSRECGENRRKEKPHDVGSCLVDHIHFLLFICFEYVPHRRATSIFRLQN